MSKPYNAMQRLLRAENAIIVREPWFKDVMGRSRWIEWPLGAPMGADGGDIYFDPALVKAFDDYVEGFVLHEYLHNLGDHIGRRGDRNAGLWNVAADLAVNQFVTKLFDLPKALCLLDPRFSGMEPEAIYDCLGGKYHLIGSNLGVALADMPPDLSGKPLQRARQKWRDAIAKAGKPPAWLQQAIAH